MKMLLTRATDNDSKVSSEPEPAAEEVLRQFQVTHQRLKGVGEMAQQVRASGIKSEYLSSIPGTHMVEIENRFLLRAVL